MRLRVLAPLLLLSSLVVLIPGQPANAQAIVPGESEEPAPPAVTPDNVREALLSLLDTGGPPTEAVTTQNPEIALGALAILMEPRALDDLRVEIAAWYALFRGAVAEQAVAEMELFELIEAEKAAAERRWDGLFERVDTDGDGVMSMEELQVAYPTLSEDLFAAMDANGDGSIDADEFQAAQDAAVLPVTDG